MQFCGAADVPRAADVTADEIAYILGHADVGVAFVENEAVLAKVESVRDRLPGLRHLIVMAGDADVATSANVHRLRDLEIAGEGLRVGGDRRAEDRIAFVNPLGVGSPNLIPFAATPPSTASITVSSSPPVRRTIGMVPYLRL